jgi:D-xylose transport system substrate-binding protein
MKLKILLYTSIVAFVVLFIAFFVMKRADAPPKKSSFKIGVCMHETQHRWAKDLKYIKSQIKEKKARVIVTDAKNNYKTQFEQAKRLILKDRVKVLIIVPENSEKARDIVNLAKQHNVKVIAYDRLILNCDLDLYIGNDVIGIGEEQARATLQNVPTGNYVLIGGGINDENSRLIRMGIENVLLENQKFGEIKIVYDNFTKNWERKEAKSIMETLIKSKKSIDAIIAANDNLALGAIDAMKEFGGSKYTPDKIFIMGQDATVDACKSILKGELNMTVYKPAHIQAYTAANVAVKMVKNISIKHMIRGVTNNGKKLVPTITLPYIHAVDKDNLDMTVLFDKYHTKKDLER